MRKSLVLVVLAAAMVQVALCATTKDAPTADCSSLLSWRCDNGDCISFASRCDGTPHCSDGSDETVRECISFQCGEGTFRCAYGACVNASAECDAHKDCVDNSDELTKKCLPNIEQRQRGNCTDEQFQCASGQCISNDDLCDGVKTCQDGSDETVEQCASKCCPPFGFKCGYGACIDERDRCNGVSNCIDNSDENDLLCGYGKPGKKKPATTIEDDDDDDDDASNEDSGEKKGVAARPAVRPSSANTTAGANGIRVQCFSYPELQKPCQIKKTPDNGWTEFFGPLPRENRPRVSTGTEVNSFTPVAYHCHDGLVLNGPATNICFNGQWMYEVPDCYKLDIDARLGNSDNNGNKNKTDG